MGMIPIILALTGFIFLWSMLTYNSLKEKFNSGLSLKEETKRLFNLRNELLNSLSIEISSSTKEFEQLGLQEHKDFIDEISSIIEEKKQNETQNSLIAKLETTNSEFISTYKAFLNQAKGYNGLIIEKPFSYLAKVLNMQPLG